MLISAATVCWLVFNHLRTNTSSKIAAKMNTECYTVLGVKTTPRNSNKLLWAVIKCFPISVSTTFVIRKYPPKKNHINEMAVERTVLFGYRYAAVILSLGTKPREPSTARDGTSFQVFIIYLTLILCLQAHPCVQSYWSNQKGLG